MPGGISVVLNRIEFGSVRRTVHQSCRPECRIVHWSSVSKAGAAVEIARSASVFWGWSRAGDSDCMSIRNVSVRHGAIRSVRENSNVLERSPGADPDEAEARRGRNRDDGREDGPERANTPRPCFRYEEPAYRGDVSRCRPTSLLRRTDAGRWKARRAARRKNAMTSSGSLSLVGCFAGIGRIQQLSYQSAGGLNGKKSFRGSMSYLSEFGGGQ